MTIEYFAILIPIIVTIINYQYNKKSIVWWEFLVPIITVLLTIFISKAVIDRVNIMFTEYWGSTIVAVYEEEPYNYWHSETCSREVACGTDSEGNTQYCTEYYDCSHQDDVGPSWWAISDIGENITISEELHDELVRQFATIKTPIDSRKNHNGNDKGYNCKGSKFEGKRVGDVSYIYQTKWDGSECSRKSYTSKHRYVNKIKASDYSVFNYHKIDDKQVDSLGLLKYPNYDNGFDFPTILGSDVDPRIHDMYKRLNGKFGKTNQLRLWLLIFDNESHMTGILQEHYWVGGNKNEVVICIGRNGDDIVWSHVFSWGLSEILDVEIKNRILDLYVYSDSTIKNNTVVPIIGVLKNPITENSDIPVLPISNVSESNSVVKIKSNQPKLTNNTLIELYEYLNDNLHRFERRSFKEFDYLSVELSNFQIIMIYIISIIVTILTNLWIINNSIYEGK